MIYLKIMFFKIPLRYIDSIKRKCELTIKKPCGCDEIPSLLLKKVLPYVLIKITSLVNISFAIPNVLEKVPILR